MSPRERASLKHHSPKDQAAPRQSDGADSAPASAAEDLNALRLFCFPYAGGGAAVFRRWHEGLSDAIEVHPVELPGRGQQFTTPAARRIDALVEVLMDAIGPYLDRPFAFYGHSMGALVAFELTRRLRAAREVEPLALYVSAQPAPQLPNRQPRLHELSDDELREELGRMGGTPQEVLANDDFMALLLPALRADFEVCETYTYEAGAALSCPIVAYGGADDREVGESDLKAWAELTTGAFAFAMLPGGHFFIDHNRQALLEALNASLALWRPREVRTTKAPKEAQ